MRAPVMPVGVEAERVPHPAVAPCHPPQRIPAILLAKLALHERLQGQGLGAELLVHALMTIVAAARSAGGRIVVVDALDESAASFYRAHDFHPRQPTHIASC
jgi:predicted N-acetyltransferase YhbS